MIDLKVRIENCTNDEVHITSNVQFYNATRWDVFINGTYFTYSELVGGYQTELKNVGIRAETGSITVSIYVRSNE